MADFVIVFDVNVYLDACEYIAAAAAWPQLGPGTANPRRNAARAIQWFLEPPPGLSFELFGDEKLDAIIVKKLTDPSDAQAHPGRGWSDHQVDRWLDQVVFASLDATNRSFHLAPPAPEEPLLGADYEDRRVWGLFCAASAERPEAEPILVTNDRTFAALANAAAPRLPSGGPRWTARSPGLFCDVMAQIAAIQ